MLSIANPYGFLLFAAFFVFGFSLMLAFNISYLRREMNKGRIFKQIRKEDVFVLNGGASDSYYYNHDHVPLGLFKN